MTRGHDIVIKTDGGDVAWIGGLTIDGAEFLVPAESVVTLAADRGGVMTATLTIIVHSVHTTDGAE